jgi:hypothetical protein
MRFPVAVNLISLVPVWDRIELLRVVPPVQRGIRLIVPPPVRLPPPEPQEVPVRLMTPVELIWRHSDVLAGRELGRVRVRFDPEAPDWIVVVKLLFMFLSWI